MPVSDEGAALQFFVEAMKANTAALEQVGKTMRGMQDEQKETLKLVHDTRERVIKIESGGISSIVAANRNDIASLKRDIDELQRDRDRRDGALSGVQGFVKIGPWLLSLVLGLLALAGWGHVK
jgi:hypothetical protein